MCWGWCAEARGKNDRKREAEAEAAYDKCAELLETTHDDVTGALCKFENFRVTEFKVGKCAHGPVIFCRTPL